MTLRILLYICKITSIISIVFYNRIEFGDVYTKDTRNKEIHSNMHIHFHLSTYGSDSFSSIDWRWHVILNETLLLTPTLHMHSLSSILYRIIITSCKCRKRVVVIKKTLYVLNIREMYSFSCLLLLWFVASQCTQSWSLLVLEVCNSI